MKQNASVHMQPAVAARSRHCGSKKSFAQRSSRLFLDFFQARQAEKKQRPFGPLF
jgi:hypothetical protein